MLSIPGFWLALILILIFSEQLRWLPTSGTGSLKYFLLPAFVLAFAPWPLSAALCAAHC